MDKDREASSRSGKSVYRGTKPESVHGVRELWVERLTGA